MKGTKQRHGNGNPDHKGPNLIPYGGITSPVGAANFTANNSATRNGQNI